MTIYSFETFGEPLSTNSAALFSLGSCTMKLPLQFGDTPTEESWWPLGNRQPMVLLFLFQCDCDARICGQTHLVALDASDEPLLDVVVMALV